MSPTVAVIVFVVALIFSVGFLLLVITLVPAINQLKYLLADLEKTSTEVRDLAIKLKEVSVKVDQDVEKFNTVLEASKETVDTIRESFKFVNKKILKQSAGFFALMSAIKLGWNFVKKMKGGKKDV